VCVRLQEPSSTHLSLANVIKLLVSNAAGEYLGGMRVKLSVLCENRTGMNLSINTETEFIRNAHPGTLRKPPGLGDYWYTGFLVDGNKCSQAYDGMICVYAFVCICVCACTRACVYVFAEFHISNHLRDYHKLD